ncbi:MAG: twin-arginine translocation signal domain-containing protein, partial [Phycisphaerae bacterium]
MTSRQREDSSIPRRDFLKRSAVVVGAAGAAGATGCR